MFKHIGRGATWYIPTAFALYDVYQAPREMKLRTVFEEGFAVLGGAVGTLIGAEVIGTGIATLLCTGPIGTFLLLFIFGTLAGIYFAQKFRKLGGNLYDWNSTLSNGALIHSPEEILGSF